VRKGVKIFLEKSKFSKNYLRIWSIFRRLRLKENLDIIVELKNLVA